MRTDRRVIVCLLILFAGGVLTAQQSAASAQSSVDTDVTIMGRDDAVIPVPEPGGPDIEPTLPATDSDPPLAVIVPPIQPPVSIPAPPKPYLVQ
jgi:hypothetical protein